MKLYFYFFLLTIVCTSCISVNVTESDSELAADKPGTSMSISEKPKNIILLIGDGMGLSQVSASLYYNTGPSNFERFDQVGLIKTSASSDLITDSAASATAYSSGVKTYNGAIGVDKDTTAVETVVETVSKNGLATGLIATSSIVHATPASFYAHVKQRRMYEEIAAYLPTSDIDFFAGGGLQFFNKRKDERDLLKELQNNGFSLHTTQLPKTISAGKQAILLAEDGMPRMIDGRGDYLPEATQLALNELSQNENGFFLMVEGSQIDWGGHNNDADYLIGEQLDFDKAVGVALNFAKNNKNTLVIVTADHETGGFTLAADGGDYDKIKPSFSTGGHSTTMVPVFAHGPGQKLFSGIFENTALYDKMMLLLNK